MSFWKKLGTGLKVGLGVAVKLDEIGVIKVKGLSKVGAAKAAIEGAIEKEKSKQPATDCK